MLSDTIINNICIGLEITKKLEEEVIEYLKKFEIYYEVNKIGLNTNLDKVRLSGGQK
jgi:ABC-type multidrug transport system fused ATPase/permease subunit